MYRGHFALAALGVFLLSQSIPANADAPVDLNASFQSGPPDTKGADSPESKLAIIKLHSIIIDKVDFEKLDIAKVLDFLNIKSKEIDPDHVDVQLRLVLPPEQDSKSPKVHRKVAITLDEVPLVDVLGYVCVQTYLRYKIVKAEVVLYPGSLYQPPSSSAPTIKR